jgi:glutathione S-transferase
MKLYHCAKARSVRVLWLLEELGMDYELETMPFDPKALQAADFLEISPLGKVPVLIDGTTRMFESVAIVEYLLNHYAGDALQPDADDPEYGQFLQWLHFGESTLMGPIAAIMTNRFVLAEDERDERAVERAIKQLDRYTSLINDELQGRDYLLGDEFTAADIVVGYAFFAMRLIRVMPTDYPNVTAWFERLMARPAYQTATAA